MTKHRVITETLTAAIKGFETQKVRIDGHIAELRAMLDGRPATPAATPETTSEKYKRSAAARRRMALGQKRRWAAIKGTAGLRSSIRPGPSKPKRKLSAVGRANIVAALKKRWAAKKAAAKTAPAAAERATKTAAAR
jgi:hypothetical protein